MISESSVPCIGLLSRDGRYAPISPCVVAYIGQKTNDMRGCNVVGETTKDFTDARPAIGGQTRVCGLRPTMGSKPKTECPISIIYNCFKFGVSDEPSPFKLRSLHPRPTSQARPRANPVTRSPHIRRLAPTSSSRESVTASTSPISRLAGSPTRRATNRKETNAKSAFRQFRRLPRWNTASLATP